MEDSTNDEDSSATIYSTNSRTSSSDEDTYDSADSDCTSVMPCVVEPLEAIQMKQNGKNSLYTF